MGCRIENHVAEFSRKLRVLFLQIVDITVRSLTDEYKENLALMHWLNKSNVAILHLIVLCVDKNC